MPEDNKRHTQIIVAAAIADALDSPGPAYPEVDADTRKELGLARTVLEAS